MYRGRQSVEDLDFDYAQLPQRHYVSTAATCAQQATVMPPTEDAQSIEAQDAANDEGGPQFQKCPTGSASWISYSPCLTSRRSMHIDVLYIVYFDRPYQNQSLSEGARIDAFCATEDKSMARW